MSIGTKASLPALWHLNHEHSKKREGQMALSFFSLRGTL
ncbi:hypothetical protein NBRC111894_875 [Sporolactobacillus inulinus]|uniref:Uncharacterized protein n=1 Tax=Sporolactobacillus inulinus TaxID=2078 RepID=A0A4Y1Z8U8_9BACL|nr:hypothetical protein NBRC111894_875 [Sporolactobacillus inulinus]